MTACVRAFALAARLANYPTRVVVGYSVDPGVVAPKERAGNGAATRQGKSWAPGRTPLSGSRRTGWRRRGRR
jgi:hypothetical protein